MVMVDERRAVITGLGTVTPLGIGIESLWEGLMERRCGLGRIQAFDASGLATQIGGQIPAFKTGNTIPKTYRKSVKVMARDIEIAVATAYEAVKDAGLRTKCLIERGEAEGDSNIDPARFGSNIGAGLICADLPELAGALHTASRDGVFSLKEWGRAGMENLTPLWLLKFLPNMLGCHVTIVHDAQATSNTITCGEASSHLAIGEAYRTIARGAADAVICGGAESKINPMGVVRQQLLERLALGHDDTPETACRPFSASRDGIVVSEGGGLLILEELECAKARGARIYAEVAGFGSSANTKSWSTPDPQGAGLRVAIEAALRDAGATPDTIDAVGMFGAGTVLHDAAELTGVQSALGERADGLPAIAIKGSLGNNGAGSGAVDIAACTMAIAHNTIPPSLNTDDPDPACRLRFAGEPVDVPIRRLLSVAYAMGGSQNAALVIQTYEE
jgi:3-oxoacyl-[acyl-carrier-protein] synthase II